jgi:hypothetical protein
LYNYIEIWGAICMCVRVLFLVLTKLPSCADFSVLIL